MDSVAKSSSLYRLPANGARPKGTSQSEPILDEQRALVKRIACSRHKEVSAFQVYAPPEKEFIALEPQFHYADPYGKKWGNTKTGMVNLQPGASVTHRVRLELFQPKTGSNP